MEVVVIDQPRRRDPADRGPVRELPLDLRDSTAVEAALREHLPSAIVHLAAQSSGARSFVDPKHTLRNNVEATLGLLEALRRLTDPRPRLLSIGSCEEYGAPADESELPLRESQPLRPGNPYAVSKAAQTLLCQQYRRAHGLNLLCTRSFTHTGPGQRPDFVWSSFAQQIARLERAGGGDLLVGNLEPSRDLSDVRDVVRVYADLLAVEWETDVVNVCSGREIVVREALEMLIAQASAPIHPVPDPTRMRPHDVMRFVGDPSRLKAMIGWMPSTPIETTLRDLLDDWRDRVAALS